MRSNSFRRHAGVTLIEVLTSTAILLVLSALIVPVIGHQKAERSHVVGNFKQLATAILVYASDNGGKMPFAYSFDTAANRWRSGFRIAAPADWKPSYSALRKTEDALGWINSVRPYYQDVEVPAIPGLPKFRSAPLTDYNTPNVPWHDVSVSYNGMLHAYPVASVVEPQQLTLFWTGMGRVRHEGHTTSNPGIQCPTPGDPCVYNPIGLPFQTAAMFVLSGSAWIEDRSGYFVTVDSSVQKRPLGSTVAGGTGFTNFDYDPFSSYSSSGAGQSFWFDGRYPLLFKPDNTF